MSASPGTLATSTGVVEANWGGVAPGHPCSVYEGRRPAETVVIAPRQLAEMTNSIFSSGTPQQPYDGSQAPLEAMVKVRVLPEEVAVTSHAKPSMPVPVPMPPLEAELPG